MFDSVLLRRHRRSRARGNADFGSEAVQRLEDRTLLSAVIDVGDYFWANGQQVPLLRVVDDASVSASFASADLAANRSQIVGPSATSQGLIPNVETSRLPAFQIPGSDARLRLTDEVYVGLDGASPQTLFNLGNGFSDFTRVPGTTDQYVATLAAGAAASLRVANALHGAAGVAFAHPNFLIEGWTASNDPLYLAQWHLNNTGQSGGTADADLDAPEAWATTTGSPDIVVAVLDTGFQLDHPDLAASIFVNTGETAGNGIDDDGNGWIDDVNGLDVGVDLINTSQIEHDGDPSPANEYDNHGTAVAGVIAAQGNNGVGVSGVAPGVKILPIKIGTSSSSGSFSTTVSAIAAAVYYAAGRTADGTGTWRGADVANHSWGIGFPLTALTQAFDWAAAHGREGLGLANFVSSGNNAGGSISYPASLASTIAVGATDHHGNRSWYSQYGAGLDFVAPGGGGGAGGWIWTTDRTGGDGYALDDYVGITGTSFSSPAAAGIAALMLSVDPTLTASEIRALMQSTADRDKATGVTFDSSGWNHEYGHGWLNAAAAVAAVAGSGEGNTGGGGGGEGEGEGGNTGSGGAGHGADLIGREDSTGMWWVSVSDGSQFQTYRWGAWATGIPWVDFVSGDFNGDGRDDVAARDANNGNIWVGLSTGIGLVTQIWGQWSTTVTLSQAEVGDFNGDGRDDLAVRVENTGDGRWYVAESTGGSFVTNLWGGWTTIKTWGQVQTGDFNGDGRTDLAGRIQNAGDGRWVTMLSTGTRFAGSIWGVWSTYVAWDIFTGDVNGDGRTDLVTRTGNADDGRWFISISTGNSFQNGSWGHVAPQLALGEALVADFTGDGKADIAVREENDGDWIVLRSTGVSGITEYWGHWSTATWTNFVIGDFDGDGIADIAGRNLTTGNWQVARSTGVSFSSRVWGKWAGGEWSFAVAADVV